MAKPTALQAQLLKAGLVNKAKVAEAARAQTKAQHAKGAPREDDGLARDVERARHEKAERDRALAATQKAQRQAAELRAQARQIVSDKQVPSTGESDYRYDAGGGIRTLLVGDAQRALLAKGALVIARLGERDVLLPRAAADQVRVRDASLIVLDHGQPGEASPDAGSEDDAYYAQFQVPDDLVW